MGLLPQQFAWQDVLERGRVYGAAPGCGCWGCRLRRGTRRRSSVHRVWQGALACGGEASQIWQCSAEWMLPLPALQGRPSGARPEVRLAVAAAAAALLQRGLDGAGEGLGLRAVPQQAGAALGAQAGLAAAQAEAAGRVAQEL